jgi:hypothetical protein
VRSVRFPGNSPQDRTTVPERSRRVCEMPDVDRIIAKPPPGDVAGVRFFRFDGPGVVRELPGPGRARVCTRTGDWTPADCAAPIRNRKTVPGAAGCSAASPASSSRARSAANVEATRASEVISRHGTLRSAEAKPCDEPIVSLTADADYGKAPGGLVSRLHRDDGATRRPGHGRPAIGRVRL